MLFVPALGIGIAQSLGETSGIPARSVVLACLRGEGKLVRVNVQHSLRAHESVTLGNVGAEVETHDDGKVSVLEDRVVNIRHVAAVLPAKDAAHRHGALGWLVQTQYVECAAHKMHQQIASDA